MVAPREGLRAVTFFCPKISKDQKKKRFPRKTSGFLVQMKLETKQNEKARSSPQTSGVMVLHYNMVSPHMVSPQNGVTQSGPSPPSNGTAYCCAPPPVCRDTLVCRETTSGAPQSICNFSSKLTKMLFTFLQS